MRKLRWIFVVVVCLLAVQVWAAGSTTVYVSTGTSGRIYAVNTATGKATALLATSGADYEGMVVGPDNAPGAAHPFLLYVCDPQNNQIIRFDPTARKIVTEIVYSGGSLMQPQCGRITATGDLVATSVNSGGLWIFSAITSTELGSAGVQVPAQSATTPFAGGGLAQKNTGDMLVVDTTGSLLRSPAPSFSTASPFISNLAKPIGVARRSDGAVFVSTHDVGNTSGVVTLYTTSAQNVGTQVCTANVSAGVPSFMQTSLDDTLYVAVASSNAGLVQSFDSTCNPIKSFSLAYPAVGVALPPTTVTKPVSANGNSALISFGFSGFELSQIAGPCGGTISVNLASPQSLASILSASGLSAVPAVNLGLDGFEAVFNTANLNKCTAKDGVTTNFQIAHFVSTAVDNPEIIVCDDQNTNCQPQAVNLQQIGGWPVGGFLPDDFTSGGTKSLRCNIFLANSKPHVTEPGKFCLFQSPVNNTNNGQLSWNLALASVFSAGKSVPVKFRLAPASSSCGSAPYITDAIAQLSVALLPDSTGNVFTPIGLISNGSSGLAQPLFKSDGNQNYLFNWDTSSCIMPSGKTQVCPKGAYSVSVQLLTDNTAGSGDSIYNTQTTFVMLK
jgi:hypothetical protein